MIIVSQNGKIINFENLVEIYVTGHDMYPLKNDIEGYCLKGTVSSGKYIVLGTYETEARAKEVLQEIIKAYLDCNEQNVLAEYAYIKNKVYEMPKE